MDTREIDENDIQDFDEFEQYYGLVETDTDEITELDFNNDLTVTDYSIDEEIA